MNVAKHGAARLRAGKQSVPVNHLWCDCPLLQSKRLRVSSLPALTCNAHWTEVCNFLLQDIARKQASLGVAPPSPQVSTPKTSTVTDVFHTNVSIFSSIIIVFPTPQPTAFHTKQAHYYQFFHTNISIFISIPFPAMQRTPKSPFAPTYSLQPSLCTQHCTQFPWHSTSNTPQFCIPCPCRLHVCILSVGRN